MKNDALQTIVQHYPQMTDKEKKIADEILSEPSALALVGVSELASKVGVSGATVSRFSKHLGFSTFKQLQIAVAKGAEDDHLLSVGSGDFRKQLETVFLAETAALKSTFEGINEALFCGSKLLDTADKILLFGLGSSFICAKDAALKFRKLQKTALALDNLHDASVLLSSFSKRDAVVCISHSGETAEVKKLLALAKERELPTVVLTTFPFSAAAKLADVLLVTSTRETPDHRVSFSSRISQTFLLDALFLATMYENKEKNLQKINQARRNIHTVKE